MGLTLMKVFYDSEMFLLQNNGGVSRYFSEIISTFVVNEKLGIEPILTFKKSNNQSLRNLSQSLQK